MGTYDVPVPLDVGAELGGDGSALTYGGGGGGAGGGGFPAPPGQGPQPGPVASFRLPPDYFPGPQSSYFRVEGNPTVAGPVTRQLVAQFQIPADSRGVIRDVEVGIANMTAATLVRFAIAIDGGTVQGWDFTVAPRAAAYVSKSFLPESTRIVVNSGATVQLLVTVTDPNPYPVFFSAAGWFAPEQVWRAFYGI